MLKKAPELFLCCAALAATHGAQAVSFGGVSPSTVLGQPLNVTVPIHLDSGERLAAECVTAEVISGETKLLPDDIRVQVQPGTGSAEWIARITTLSVIEEPVVEVSISAGCERRFMRRFTAFADPPRNALATAALGALVAASGVSLPASAGASTRPLSPRTLTQASPPVRAVVPPDRAGSQPPARPRPAPVRRTVAASAAPRDTATAAAVPDRAAPAVPDTQASRLVLDVSDGPRLRMDLEAPVMPSRSVAAGIDPAAAAEAGSAAFAGAGMETSADTERLALLEKTLADLKREGQITQRNNEGIRTRLADAEAISRLTPWLFGLLVFLALLSAWLVFKLRRQARELEAAPQHWWASGSAPLQDHAVGPVPVPGISVAGELIDDTAPRPATPVAQAAWPEAKLEADVNERTEAYAGPFGLESAPPSVLDAAAASLPEREVSVEELLDLEQQADFFIALGQEDAAVDLLMAHLRSAGGLSPLPYTKLLEIYKRQGDRGAYERIRARFNRRFNAYAPHWDVGPLQGRVLEEYEEVVQYLQSIWASPLDAMASLEAMLFRRDESQELFDLPAYKDVLLLYSLARDLWQQGGGTGAEVVDVLLPLGEATMAGSAGIDRHAPLDLPGVGHEYDLTAFELEPRISVRAELDGPKHDDLDLPPLPPLPPLKRD